MKGSRRLRYLNKDPQEVKWIKPSQRDVYFALFVISPILIWAIAKLWVLPIIIN